MRMTTVDITAEEIEGAPLLINPQVKEVKPDTKSRLNLALCIVLAINLLTQLIAIVTPGWNVVRSKISSSYESVYYRIECIDTTPLENVSTTACTTVTFQKDFSERFNIAKDTLKPALVSAYNLRVRHQINIQFSWLTVAGTTIFQITRYIKTNEAYPTLTAINAVALVCACSAMYQALYEVSVQLDYTLRQAEHSSATAGFPYSVLLYCIAFIQTCACAVLVLKQIYDYIRHIELALTETKIQVETLRKQYETEVEEFKHFRQLHSDKNRLRGRSRKSHAVDRHSHRTDNRVTSVRHSVKPKDPKHFENRNNHRDNLNNRPHARSSRKRNIKDRQTRHLEHSVQSGASRDSSPTSHDRLNSIHGQPKGPIESSSRPDKPPNTEYPSALHESLPESTENLQLIQNSRKAVDETCATPSKVQTEERQNQDDLENSKVIHKTQNSSNLSNSKEIVSAEVHIPSIDGT